MYTNSKTAKAVRLAMMFGASATMAVSTSAFSAEEEESAESLERIEVTGSRIKRADLEGASPVTVITAEDMKIEGNFTVADALRNSTFNSFGSFSERSGSSAQSQATVDLRGAGSQRTLVLLDGKRFPGSPTMGGQSANLNAIPMSAVERIEILTDGASSTYGSDALAGVVNVILKKNVEGLHFTGGVGQRDRDASAQGTTSREFSMLAGVSDDKGNITISYDHQQRDGISDGARSFTAARAEDLDGDGKIEIYTDETDGWSYYGANVASLDFSEIHASPLCDDLISQYGNDTFQRMSMEAAWGPGSDVCAFAYANVSYNKTAFTRDTLFVDANYEVADGVEWFGRAMFTKNLSFGRYAPPAAPWNNMPASSPHNPYGTEGNKGYFRWVGIGNRDNNVADYNQDYLTGFRGDLDWNNATWEVYYHRNDADNKSIGQYYLSYGGLAHNEANGIDLGSAEGIDNMRATTLQESSGVMDQVYGGLGFDLGELSGGSIAHYVGMEYMEIGYADIYDGQSAAGLVGGSSGSSASGSRDVTAMFYESVMPVTDDVEVNVAVRYDDYSDFGDNLAPKVNVRWQALDNLVVRASYSEAFRAPGLDDLNAATAFSASSAFDYKQCNAAGIANADCPSKQFDTYIKSNANLGPETSEYINLGFAWDIDDNHSIKMDYFDLQIENVIQQKSVQGLLSDEASGLITAVAPGTNVSDDVFYLVRSSSGTLIEVGTGLSNGTGFNITGLDVTWNSNFETSFGDISLSWVNSFVTEYETEVGGYMHDTAGWSGQPDHKSNMTTTWRYDAHSVTYNMNYTASTSATEIATGANVDIDGKLDSWLIHNLTYTFDADSYGQFTLQVVNVTDEDPVLSPTGTYDDANLYNNYGRDFRASYSISF